MSRERTPAGNILALARTRQDQVREVEETATSYMPTDVDLETLMPDAVEELQAERDEHEARPPAPKSPQRRRSSPQASAIDAETKRKRISLYLDDDVLTKIFRVSLERHEQLSSATHRLILEALKARGL